MTQIYTFTINEEKGRIDKVLAELLPTHSRSQIQQWVKEGAVYVNDEAVKQNYKVKAGDLIQATVIRCR